MSKTYVIGLDIGTTSVKAVAFNKIGEVQGEHEVEYPLYTPQTTWAEQDPLEIEEATIKVLRQLIESNGLDPNNILAVGLSSAMHSLICMTKEGEPLSPSITWADGRASAQAMKLKEKGHSLYTSTGTPIHPMSPLMKLVWMRETNYQPYQAASKFVSIKEFLLFRWFGSQVVDYSIASATGLFDLHTHKWNSDALDLAGITEEQLFTPVPPTKVIEGIQKNIAQRIGIPVDLPFVIGASDGPLANLGIGAINPGEVAITIGTSGAIRQLINSPKTDELQKTFCYTFTDSLSLIGGPTNNGGIVLRWLRETFGSDQSYESLLSLAGRVSPGCEGLLFLPYLNGERAPMWNSKVRGNLFGLSLRHGKEHIIRAGLEGVIYSIYHVGQALERQAGKPTKLLASGGFARSPLWLQILADVFDQEVQVPLSHQSSAWGAAWIALNGINQVGSLQSIKDHIPMLGTYQPNKDHHKLYQEIFSNYEELSKNTDTFYR
jgi:gluconokinase